MRKEFFMTPSDSYAELAKRLGYGESTRFRQILEFLMTPPQADLVVLLPATPEDLAAKLNLPLERINSEIETLFLKGVVFPKNFQTRENPRFARSVGQFHDATQSILDLENKIYDPEARKELYRLWEDFCENEWYPNQVKRFSGLEKPPTRIIPAYSAIKDLPDVQPYEDMREIIKAQKVTTVNSCSCRKRRNVVGLTCGHSHDVNCLQFNRGAEYAIVRGTGRQLNYEEAMELVDQIEQDGLVHNWPNDRRMTGTTVMCNCCVDCCMIWHPIDTHQGDIGKMWEKSRFQAQVNQDLCSGCQTCVDRCMFNAIEMVKVPGTKKLKAQVDPEKCFGCGVCVVTCEEQALKMKTVRPPDHIPEAAAGKAQAAQLG
jgi:H+/Na+-translocating ferredoxin:NAD+ oxidoreductase subunit B